MILMNGLNNLKRSNMEKEFVPYNLALKMKQLGFDEPCIYYVDKQNNSFIYNFQRHPDEFIEWCGVKVISTPTFSQAFRWFRDEYKLFGEITLTSKQEDIEAFEFFVLNINEPLFESNDYTNYEEAEIACLEKLIEIVEKK